MSAEVFGFVIFCLILFGAGCVCSYVAAFIIAWPFSLPDYPEPEARVNRWMAFAAGSAIVFSYLLATLVPLPLPSPVKSGLEPIPGYVQSCSSVYHAPPAIQVPAGQRYRHVCPRCGEVTLSP